RHQNIMATSGRLSTDSSRPCYYHWGHRSQREEPCLPGARPRGHQENRVDAERLAVALLVLPREHIPAKEWSMVYRGAIPPYRPDDPGLEAGSEPPALGEERSDERTPIRRICGCPDGQRDRPEQDRRTG